MSLDKSPSTEKIIEAMRSPQEIAVSDLYHAAWDAAQVASITRYWSGEEAPAGRHAEARLIWSDEALCARFVCRQAEPLVVSDEPQVSHKTIGLWERDVCELFIAPDARNPRRYFEFEAAPTGEWLDLLVEQFPDKRETDWEYHSGMTVAAGISPGELRIAIRVPWNAMGRMPRAGERWRANLTRCVGADPTRGYLAWQPTRTPEPNFHAPEVFGEILFK